MHHHSARRPRRRRLQRGAAVAILLCLFMALSAGAVFAADITVNTTTDDWDGGGSCSLREAVNAANNNANSRGCVASGGYGTDTIVVPAGVYNLTRDGTFCIDGGISNQDLDISSSIIISGSGALSTVIQRSASCNFRIFEQAAGGTNSAPLEVHNVTLRNGRDAWGGAISSYCNDLLATGVRFEQNRADTLGGVSSGGAILAGNLLANCGSRVYTILDSTFMSNTTSGSGGAINHVDAGSTAQLRVAFSSFIGNSSTDGGGAVNTFENTSMVNSTFSGNATSGGDSNSDGGAFRVATLDASEPTIQMFNLTFTGNYAGDDGGAFHTEAGTITLNQSIVSGNNADGDGDEVDTAGGAINPGCLHSTPNIYGRSGIDDTAAFSGGFAPCFFDINLTDSNTPTPLGVILNPLADNGGPTLTHDLPGNSPAIDAGSLACIGNSVTNDQRRLTRPAGLACDIGAVEQQPENITAEIKQTSTAGSSFVAGAPYSFGTYNLNLTMLNTGTMSLENLFFRVESSGNAANELANRDAPSPAGVGAIKKVANSSLPGGNDLWDPGESHTELFVLGLNAPSFKFIFNLYTYGPSGADGAAEPMLIASFEVDADPALLPALNHKIYIPLLTK